MVNAPQQIDRLDEAPGWTATAAAQQTGRTPSVREVIHERVPRPHIPLSAFVNTDDAATLGEKAIDEDEYDDSAIIVIEERDSEWQCDSGNEPEFTAAREEVEPQSEYGPPLLSSVRLIGCGLGLEEGAYEQTLESLLDLSLSVVSFERTGILGQETVTPLAAPSWLTSFAVRTDETADLMESTANEITKQPSNLKTKEIESEYVEDQQSQTISRTLAIQECYREAAAALERHIELKAAKTVLTVIVAGDEVEPTRRESSLAQSVTSFTYPLALALSADRRVLLVDLVSNDACLELGFQSGAGIMGVACGRLSPAEAVLATASPQVDLLPFGAVECEQQTALSLDSVRLATAITTLAREYDLVLIATVIDDVLEEFRLARAIDLAVLAVPCGEISIDAIKAASARLESIGIQPAGILLLDSPSRAVADSTD